MKADLPLCYMRKWILGIISSVSKKFRIELVSNINSSTIKNFIRSQIENDNVIISNEWQTYNWLNELFSVYQDKVHIHEAHDFGHGLEFADYI